MNDHLRTLNNVSKQLLQKKSLLFVKLLLFAFLSFTVTSGLFAQSTYNWTGAGSDNNWSTGGNWGGTAPTSPQAYLNFAGTTRLSNTNNLSGSAGFKIYFTSTAGAFTLGGNSITFYDYSSSIPNIGNQSSNIQTINFPIVDGNSNESGAFYINGQASSTGGAIVFNSTVMGSGGTRSINIASGGNSSSYAGPITFNGVISNGSGSTMSLVQTGSFNTTVLNAANTFSGGVTLTAGTVDINNNSALGTGTFTITTGTIDNTSAADVTITNAESWGGSFTYTGSVHNLLQTTGAITLTGNPTITVSAKNLSIGGAIGGGAHSITKAGSGTLTLSGTNTYSSGTTLTSGPLNINTAAALGTGTTTVNGGTLTLTTSGYTATITNPSNNTTVAVAFSPAPSNGSYAIVPGALTVNGTLAFSATGLGAGQTASLNTTTGMVSVSAGPAPTISSVAPSTPIITGELNDSGYTGQTVTITGTNFLSGTTVTVNGVAATSVTVVSSTQLTAVVANAGAASTGNVVVTTANGGASRAFAYLGYITVNPSSADWNTGSTWLGGVPVANATTTVNTAITVNNTATNQPGTVLVNSGSSISIGASTGVLSPTASVTNNGTVTVGGTLTLGAASTNGTAGTISVSSGGTLAVSGGLTNNGLLTDGGTMTVSTTTSTNSSTGTLNVPSGGTLTASGVLNNSGGMTIGGTITLNGGSTNTSTMTVSTSGTIILGNGLTNNGTLSVSGIFQLNGGGYISGTSPSYTTSSTLVYNSNYGVYNEWSGGGTIPPVAGVGVPGNVTINSGNTVSLPNSGSTHPVAVGVPGNVTILGTGGLALSTTSGLDFYIGGNWSRASGATFTPNNRAVNFVGSGMQAITVTGGGTETFAYLTTGGSGTVQLSATAGSLTSVAVDSSNGLKLGSTNTTSAIDLNGQTMTISGGGNMTLGTSGAKKIISSTGTGTFAVSSYLTVTTSAGGTLVFGNNVLVGLTNGMDFGSGLSTIGGGTNGTLQLNTGGYVANNHPVTYGTGSLLQYNSANTFGRNTEWSTSSGAGYPYNVQVSNATTINYPNGGVAGALALAGNLTVDQNSSLYLDYGYNNTPANGANGPLTIGGNVSLGGIMTLSTISGGDLVVKGNWTITTGSFNNNGRLVTFSGNSPQTISGATTFGYLTINNTSGGVTLNSPITIQNVLNLTNGILTTTGTNIPSVTSTATGGITGGSTTSFINGPVSWMLPAGLSTSANVYAFPVGAGTTYLPYSVTSITTGGTGPTLQIQAFTGPSGGTGDGTTLATSRLSTTEYWSSTLVSGSYSNASISLTRQAALNGLNVIGQSSSQEGAYTSIGGTASSPSINNSGNTGGGTTQFYVMAQAPAIAPASATLTAFTTTYGTASAAQTVAITGSALTGNITTATAPTGFEVSTDGSTYGSTATFNQSGGSASGTLYIRLAATATVSGSYNNQTITLSSTGAANATITTAASGNTVSAASLTASLTGTVSKTYDGTTTATLTTANYNLSGVAAGDAGNVTVTNTSGTYDTKSVGTGKTVTVSSLVLGGSAAGNYTLSNAASVSGAVGTITAAGLTITANNITKCNGATYTFAGTEFTTGGLAAGDAVSSVSLTSAGAAAGAAANTYPIAASAAMGTGLSNYTISYVNGTMTVEAPVAVTLTQVNPDCHGNAGSLTTNTVTGGSSPYTYKINTGAFNPSGTYVSNPLFGSLAAGGYTYAVKDAYGCIGTVGAILSQLTKEPVLINNAAAPLTVPVCYGGSTTITTTVAGGNAAFTYTLNTNGVNGTAQQSANRYFTVGAGSYYIIVADSHGCTYNTDTIAVTQPSTALSLSSAVSTSIVSCTSSASTIAVTAAGGYSSSYTYSDNNGSSYQAGSSFGGLAPAVQTVYNLVVKDAMGCTATGTATVQATSQYVLSSSAITGNTQACYGGTTTISTTPSGGTAPYTYSLDGSSTFVSSTQRYFATVGSGTHYITVKDNAGCTYRTPSIMITQPSAPVSFTSSATNANCTSSTGSITVTAAGGYGGYSYSDNNGSTFQAGSSFTSLAAGTYNIVVKDMNGCTAYNTATVKQPTFTTSAISGNLTVCYGATTSISTVPSGGVSPYVYSLNGAAPVSQANRIFSVPAGSYYITVTDNAGCTATTPTVNVTQPSAAVTFTAVQGGSGCTGNAGISVTAAGGYGHYSYSDNGGSSYQKGNLFSGLGYGSYTVSVKDTNGCASAATVVKLTALTSSAIQGSLTVCTGGTTTIYTVPSGGAPPYTYNLDSTVYVPSNERYFNVSAGTHTITVKDNASCTYTPAPVTVTGTSCLSGGGGTGEGVNQKIETAQMFAAHVSPNPAQTTFHLQMESSSREDVELIVTNMLGVKVYEGKGGIGGSYEFGENFTSGMYILQIRQGNTVHTVKLVKGN